MSWKFFIGATVLATGLLIKVGAPLVPIVVGIAMAAFVNWRRERRASARR